MGIINTKYSAEDVKIDELPFFSGTTSLMLDPKSTITIMPCEHIADDEPMSKKSKEKEERKFYRDHRLYTPGRIYKISNTVDKLVYIGSTVGTIGDRFEQHKKDSRDGSTWALHLHMRALGAEHFSIELLDAINLITIDELHVIESKYMSMHRSVIAGLNSQYSSRVCYHGLVLKKCKDCNVGIACEHYFDRRVCFDCKYTENALDICCHSKMRTCCHLCNRCAYCIAICTEEHKITKGHIQNEIKAGELKARIAFIHEQNTLQNEMLERINFTHARMMIMIKRKDKRLGKIKLRKLIRKRVNLTRSAWDVYLELVNQADN